MSENTKASEVGTVEEMLDRWNGQVCRCDASVRWVCELCNDLEVVERLLQSNRQQAARIAELERALPH